MNVFYLCHSERSEESSWIIAPLFAVGTPAGFFAALRMTEWKPAAIRREGSHA
jgi:hypothetical protein